MQPEDSDPPAPQLAPVRLTQIEVDVDGLRDFRAFLARELDINVKPAAHAITYDHGMGVGFGVGNAGRNISSARQRYADSLQASTINLAEYVKTAEVVIDAIHRVAAQYVDADLSSAATARAVDQELAAAFTTVTLRRNEAIQRDRDLETHREDSRPQAGRTP